MSSSPELPSGDPVCAGYARVRDAKVLAYELFPEFSVGDFVGLPKYHIYLPIQREHAS